jgi:hypothetical protein
MEFFITLLLINVTYIKQKSAIKINNIEKTNRTKSMKKRHSGFSQKFDHDKIHYHYFLNLLTIF